MASKLPKVYGSDPEARGKERQMGPVLQEKWDYLGGKEVKAKELAQAQKAPVQRNVFIDMYRSFQNSKFGQQHDPTVAYNEVASTIDISSLNPRILAVAKFLIDEHEIRSIEKIDGETLVAWVNNGRIWPSLLKTLDKRQAPKIETQVQDIFRYILMLLNFQEKTI